MKRCAMILLCLALCAGTAAMGGCGDNNGSDNGGGNGGEDVYVIRLASTENDGTPTSQGVLKFKELIEEKSGGRIEVEYLGNSVMGGEREITESVVVGTLEAGLITSSLLTSYLPDWAALDLPYVFKDRYESWDALDGEAGDFLKAETQGIGVEVLAFSDGSMRCVTNARRPVASLADFKGLKLRTLETEVALETFNELGASPIPMAFGEVYTAIQQGTIDGLDTPPIYVPDGNFQEVEKYYTQTDHQICCMMIIINSDFLASMPEDLQQLVRNCCYEGCTTYEREIILDAEENAKKIMADAGMVETVLTEEALSEIIEATRPVISKYAKQIDGELLEMLGLSEYAQ